MAIPDSAGRKAEEHSFLRLLLLALLIPTACLFSQLYGAEISQEETDFFETRIRPVLVENCYLCHGPQAEATGGGLRLDQREGLLHGGSRGPSVMPGSPGDSLLIEAMSYRDPGLQMPPSGKLSDQQIADFVRWVQMGAPDPRQPDWAEEQDPGRGIDLEQARAFWSLQPIKEPPLPEVDNPKWIRSPVDRFVLARLEKENLAPAPAATKRVLLRRVTFSLTGLPPTPREVEDFLADESPQAYGKVVERLLASPHYGERWARHWLDLVRFAETSGHEYDNSKLDAWRYRDYVIRAFNSDLPYNRFLAEQIAGDLIPEKRLSPEGDYWESSIGTTHLWFGEVLNSPTDPVKSRADEVDNQLDVLGKAFLGLTLACARCHDHKFDPIPTADYYSVAGILHSTEYAEEVLDSPTQIGRIAATHAKIGDLNSQIGTLLQPLPINLADRLSDDLLAAAEAIWARGEESDSHASSQPEQVRSWIQYLEEAAAEPDHVFYPLTAVLTSLREGQSFEQALAQVRDELTDLARGLDPQSRKGSSSEEVFEDFDKPSYAGWRTSGQAFGSAPRRDLPPNQSMRGAQVLALASSFGDGTNRLMGSLTSDFFETPKRWMHVRLAGSNEGGKG